MTVAIAVVSGDGLVLATDSRTTFAVAPGTHMRVLSDFTHKVFQVGRFGAVTFGWAFLLGRQVSAHMETLAHEIGDGHTVEATAQAIRDRFKDLVEKHVENGLDPAPPGDVLGFLVGGYDDSLGTTIQVSLPSGSMDVQHTTDNPGAAWRGQTDVISRLVNGVDWDNLETFAQFGQMADSGTTARGSVSHSVSIWWRVAKDHCQPEAKGAVVVEVDIRHDCFAVVKGGRYFGLPRWWLGELLSAVLGAPETQRCGRGVS